MHNEVNKNELFVSSALFYSVFNKSHDALLLVRDGIVLKMNKTAQEMFEDREQRGLEPTLSGIISSAKAPVEVSITKDIVDGNIALAQVEYHKSKNEGAAHFDSLTKLPNRQMFHDFLDASVKTADSTNTPFSVMFLDLDKFKAVNDTMGHAAGDTLLKAVALRLEAGTRSGDMVARLGGDEFAILHFSDDPKRTSLNIAERLIKSVSAPYDIMGQEVYISTSIGIAYYPENASSAEEILKQADLAMYSAKEEGRNGYKLYNEEMAANAELQWLMADWIRDGIKNNEFYMEYQPRLDIHSGLIKGQESLLRWRKPGEGKISPAEFIPHAEKSGLIKPLGDLVIDMVFKRIIEIQKNGGNIITSINLSPNQFRGNRLDQKIIEKSQEMGIDPKLVEFEITENIFMEESGSTKSQLKALKDFGFTLAIDDFGKGYSSLDRLTKLPIEIIKIDMAFVRNMHVDKKKAALVQAIITLSHTLGKKVVAEGVEGKEILDLLQEYGCDEAQGWHIGHPKDFSETCEFISNYNATVNPESIAA